MKSVGVEALINAAVHLQIGLRRARAECPEGPRGEAGKELMIEVSKLSRTLLDAAEALDLEAATAINNELFRHAMHRMGVADSDDKPNTDLRTVPLLDLAAASRIIRAVEDRGRTSTDARTITTVLDDRAVAAQYAVYQYQVAELGDLFEDDGNHADPLAEADIGTHHERGLYCIAQRSR